MKRIRLQKKIGVWKGGTTGADPPPPTKHLITTAGDNLVTTSGDNIKYT